VCVCVCVCVYSPHACSTRVYHCACGRGQTRGRAFAETGKTRRRPRWRRRRRRNCIYRCACGCGQTRGRVRPSDQRACAPSGLTTCAPVCAPWSDRNHLWLRSDQRARTHTAGFDSIQTRVKARPRRADFNRGSEAQIWPEESRERSTNLARGIAGAKHKFGQRAHRERWTK
jgi:hypothetical protein